MNTLCRENCKNGANVIMAILKDKGYWIEDIIYNSYNYEVRGLPYYWGKKVIMSNGKHKAIITSHGHPIMDSCDIRYYKEEK